MSRSNQIKRKQLFIITICWMVMGFLISVHDYLLLQTADSLGTADSYSFLVSVVKNMSAGLIGALLGGTTLVFYVNVKYQDKPYGYTLLIVAVTFVLIVALVSVLMGLVIVPARTGRSLSDPVTQQALIAFLKDTSHLKALLAWSFVVIITQLMLQVSSKFGQPDFWNIISGKYNRPKEEKRIFMFVDLNASTTIAEQLGDERYHSLLKDFFADITTPILENKGSIHQYVGDEVVIAWNYHDGRENLQCIRCFFDMKTEIEKRRDKYLKEYGLVPGFKAGIHCGRVVAGEVGIIKRDITYSGDVLNTTSRILNMCNQYSVEMIASGDLLTEVEILQQFESTPLGAIKLRGRDKEVFLNSVRLPSHVL
jgi:adenylate cyclase